MGGKSPWLVALMLGLIGGCMADSPKQDPQHAAYDPMSRGASPSTINDGNSRQVPISTNKPPVVEDIPDKDARAGLPFAIGVDATDPEQDEPLTYRFSVPGDLLPAQNFSNGLLQFMVPDQIGSGTITAVITVTDSRGNRTDKAFRIHVQGNTGASPIKQAIENTCPTISDPIARAACELGGAFSQ